MKKLFNLAFGCWHEWSWPMSKVNGKRVRPYQVCLKCGKEQESSIFRAA